MDSDRVLYPTVKERKLLLGIVDELNLPQPHREQGGHRNRILLEDPFPLREPNTPGPTRKYKTVPRKPKIVNMADKPPIAPRPGITSNAPQPMPRKKGHPPLKPIPYLKHREHKKNDVSTFKSNHPIIPPIDKTSPPQPLEKPPRRNSAKGQPSSEFYQPKSKEQSPVQYSIPSVPGRLLKDNHQGPVTGNRPRLDTPVVPAEPPQHILSDDNPKDTLDNSSVGPSRSVLVEKTGDSTVNGSQHSLLYCEAYDHVQVDREEIQEYAVVSLPEPQPRLGTPLHPPPLSPKPVHILKDQIMSTTTSNTATHELPPEQHDQGDEDISGEYAVVAPVIKRISIDKLVRSPSPLLSTASHFSFQPSGGGGDEYSVTVHPNSPALRRDNSTTNTGIVDGCFHFDNGSSHSNHSPRTPNTPNDTPEAQSPCLLPTQEDNYSHLKTTQANSVEYELIGQESCLNEGLSSLKHLDHPVAKARIASQKIKAGSVTVQSARDRSELICFHAGERLTSEAGSNKPPEAPPRTKKRPVILNTGPDHGLVYHPLDTIVHNRSVQFYEPNTSNEIPHVTITDQMLEKAGYETVNTFSPEPYDDTFNKEVLHIEDDNERLSPKVEVDIDHIVRVQSALKNNDSKTAPDPCYENQLVIDTITQDHDLESESPLASTAVVEVDLSSPDTFIVPQHAVPGPLGYCAIDVHPINSPLLNSDSKFGERVIEGDMIKVHHQQYPDSKGYYDLKVVSTSSINNTNPGSAPAVRSVLKSTTQVDETQDVRADVDDTSPSHEYEVVASSPNSKIKQDFMDAPKTKTKPKRDMDGWSTVNSSNVVLERNDNNLPTLSNEIMSDVKQVKKSINLPRRAPPPPPSANSHGDSSIHSAKRDIKSVSGSSKTLPRGQKFNVSPKAQPPTRWTESHDKISNQQSVELGPVRKLTENDSILLNETPASPKKKVSSPMPKKKGANFFKKLMPNGESSPATSPSLFKRSFRKKGRREIGQLESRGPVLSAADKTKSLPGTGRTHKPFALPTLDLVEDDDGDNNESGIYSTIEVAFNKKPVASGVSPPTANKRDTKPPVLDESGYEVIESKRSSFRKKKSKKGLPLRKTSSVEHLYDEARPPLNPPHVLRHEQNLDELQAGEAPVAPSLPLGHPVAKPLNPDLLPEGVDITSLYAVVTSKRTPLNETENNNQIAFGTEHMQDVNKSSDIEELFLTEEALGGSICGEIKDFNRDHSVSPSKNSLYEREGIVVTSLDEKFGNIKTESEETFVSSADIEHTVSGGEVYAVVKTNRPKSKTNKDNVTNESANTLEHTSMPEVEASNTNLTDTKYPGVPSKPPRTLKGKPMSVEEESESLELPRVDMSLTANDWILSHPGPSLSVDEVDNTSKKTVDILLPIVRTPSLSSGSGPPSFPPPPPPKGSTPEPGGSIPDDPPYEIIPITLKKSSATKIPRVLVDRPVVTSPTEDEELNGIGYASISNGHRRANGDVHRTQPDSLPPSDMILHDDAIQPDMMKQQRPPHLYATVKEEMDESAGGVVAVRMVSHGYAMVTDKNRVSSKQLSKKKLAPRTRPPPAPPVGHKRSSGSAPSMNDSSEQIRRVSSTAVEFISPSESGLSQTDQGSESHLTKRLYSTDSIGRADYKEPKFLFSEKLCQSLIAVGDDPDPTPSPCPSTITLASIDDDSDADVMYSTEWDSTSDEEDERETVPHTKTYYIAREILTTERTFVKGLTLLDKDFRQAVRSANNAHDKPVLSDESLKLILGNVSSLLSLNSGMLQELEIRMSKWDEDPRIGDILLTRAPYLKLYTEYISKFDKALKTLDECSKKNPLFAELLHEFEAQPKCASLPLAGYMLDIVHRITRYKLLLTDYVKHLHEDSDDHVPSEKALVIISDVATHVNETIRQMDNFRKVVEVRKRLIGDAGDTLITPYRKLLKEGELLKFARKERQPRMFFLFNDILIYASSIPPSNNTYKVIKRIPLEGMQVGPLNDPEMRYGFQIISTCKSFRLEASNREEKHQWLTAFDTAIKGQAERRKNREKARRNLLADQSCSDDTDSVPLGHLAPPWLPDSAVSMCQLCSVSFTVTRRRHHCRACGMVYCADCSSYYATLKYMNNKTDRVCQSCYEKINSGSSEDSSPQKQPGTRPRPHKMVSMPSVLREVKARDQSAQISGYLQAHTSKSKRWKKRWYVVYNLVLYEFERHEDGTAKRSITLPSYQVISPVPRHDDPLVFVLKHAGTGKEYFKVENTEQLERWIEVLQKAVCGEVEGDIEPAVNPNTSSPEVPLSPHSLDSQEPDTVSQ